MRILYYAESDPFAGIGQTVDDFRAARAEVALSCLLHNVVAVQPDNLLEHALTLPIFEHMAPFVRAGRLVTSADVRAALASGARSIDVVVEISDDMMPGVVSLPHGWGHDQPGARMDRPPSARRQPQRAVRRDPARSAVGQRVLGGVPITMQPL